jgi:micrococcal nuclease
MLRAFRPRGLAGLLLLLVLLAAGWLQARGDGDPGNRGSPEGPAAAPVVVEVDRVVDGDTARVFYDGQSEYVRYIGIDTPESVDPESPVECFGEEAKEFNEWWLGGGKVRLVFGPELRDRFGRLLAYVYVRDVMLNAELLRGGFAETLTIPPNDAESARFERIEAEARDSGLGMWGACG